MGLFSRSSSTTTVNEEIKDNRVLVEGTPEGIFLSPEARLTQTFQGDFGFSGDEINSIVSGLIEQKDRSEERATQQQKALTNTFAGQQDKLTELIESLKSDGGSNQRFLPFIFAGLIALLVIRR